MKLPAINSPIYPLAGLVAAGLVLYFGGDALFSKIKDAIPQTVKDGAQAATAIGGAVLRAVTDPADAFGVSPSTYSDGTPTWAPTVPWESNDPVSNNDSGINWNLF